MADLPVPTDTARAYRAGGAGCRNLGLLFDRFVPYGPGWVMEGDQKSTEARKLVDTVNGWRGDGAYRALFNGLQVRWQAAVADCGGASFTAAPEWRMVVGLGRDSAFETGMTLHRIYGCPYVPGSALKGMTRAWAKATEAADAARLAHIFGPEDTDEAGAGNAIFFDALPVTPPKLELDMTNPHYPDYYRDQREHPTGWQSPVPVYFMTVAAGTAFIFGVGARRGDTDAAEEATEWMREALTNMGIGGKTTSGYGYWTLG